MDSPEPDFVSFAFPPELFTKIVIFAAEDDPEAAWVLSETCKTIRDLVISNPRAWRRVHLPPRTFDQTYRQPAAPSSDDDGDDDENVTPPVRPLTLWLERSRTEPIDLSIELSEVPSRVDRLFELQKVMLKMHASSHQIDVHFASWVFVDGVESFRVHLNDCLMLYRLAIRSLHLEGIYPFCFQDLVESLAIHHRTLENSPDLLESIALRCSRLKNLRVQSITPFYKKNSPVEQMVPVWQGTHWTVGPLSLESAPVLCCVRGMHMLSFLQFHAPALRTLVLEGCQQEPDLSSNTFSSQFGPALAHFVRHAPELRALDICDSQLSKEAACDILRRAPNLEDLRLGDMLVTEDLSTLHVYSCDYITGPSSSGRNGCRSLKYIDVRNCEHRVQQVQLRRAYSNSAGPL
ncbi:hypothetical protein BD626DRAFT_501629 [Schizophyllum amplum]|uniref:F-box domain-containing protein n=1 Tax=Schizophyllum amplum TaxID=97359 RepID=A0A550C9Z4_9AGAR|nr:hypothetical protein BD626DRAFT_501629 [Auriculariopsis ampla]